MRKIYLVFMLVVLSGKFAVAAVHTVGANGNYNYTTLTAAITAAASGDTISVYGTITSNGVAGEGIVVNKNLKIFGQSAESTIIQAAETQNTANKRVFTIYAGRTVTLKNLTIRHGKTATSGYPAQWGGGIMNYGILTVDQCIISNNNANSSGGAIYNDKYFQAGANGILTVTNSLISNNVGADYGSGICNGYFNTTMTLTNCTFIGNTGSSAIALDRSQYSYITNCTVINNGSDGLWTYAAGNNLYLKNTILADNTGNDFTLLSGASVSESYNIVETSSGYTFSGTGTLTGQQANLNISGTLQTNNALNGIPTLSLSAGSVAIDAGNSASNNGTVTIPCKDQRGYLTTNVKDIGAYEYNGTLNQPNGILINTHPASQTGCQGMTAIFSVSSNATEVQWRKDGQLISGANSTSLEISAVVAADTGSYDCILTNSCGVTFSNPALLTLDVSPPVFDVTNLPTLYGSCDLVVNTPTASDNCEGTINASTNDPLTFSAPGSYSITWNYSDQSGNTASQGQTVVIDDAVDPIPQLVSLPQINASCSVTLVAPLANDYCSGVITGVTSDPTTYSSPGTYQVEWTYTDANGNSSTQQQAVVIADQVAPIPDVTNLPTVNFTCSGTVTAPTAADNCSGPLTATTNDNTTFTTAGNYTVTWTYEDNSGNTVSQTQQISVTDNQAPVPDISSLPQINAVCNVTLTAPTATDICSGQVTASTTDPIVYTQQGTYTVTWTYEDTNGNTVSQSQLVVVNDADAPVPIITSLPALNGSCGYSAVAPEAIDNCLGLVTATTSDPTTFNGPGVYQINWEYTDANNNISNQTQFVIIADNESPVPVSSNLPDVTGACQVSLIPPIATDNCAGTIQATTNDPLQYAQSGNYSVTWIYDDGNGNTVSQNQQVIVTALDVSVTANGPTLVSNATNVSYQWLDCGSNYAPVSGENSSSFNPLISGYYAVRITGSGCSDTSACQFVSINPSGINSGFSERELIIYPNPSSGKIFFKFQSNESDYKIAVYNQLGAKVHEQVLLRKGPEVINFDFVPGVYYVRGFTDNSISTHRIIIKR